MYVILDAREEEGDRDSNVVISVCKSWEEAKNAFLTVLVQIEGVERLDKNLPRWIQEKNSAVRKGEKTLVGDEDYYNRRTKYTRMLEMHLI